MEKGKRGKVEGETLDVERTKLLENITIHPDHSTSKQFSLFMCLSSKSHYMSEVNTHPYAVDRGSFCEDVDCSG